MLLIRMVLQPLLRLLEEDIWNASSTWWVREVQM
jgi:hypothetical protein